MEWKGILLLLLFCFQDQIKDRSLAPKTKNANLRTYLWPGQVGYNESRKYVLFDFCGLLDQFCHTALLSRDRARVIKTITDLRQEVTVERVST